MRILKKSFNKKIDGTGLAIFRITYSTVLLCEIIQLFYFRHLIFDKIPYLMPAEIDFGIPIIIWAIAVVAIIFGFRTRFFTIINYLLSLILIGTITTYEYHVFYAYMGVNFLLMFMPISQCLSLDRLIEKLKYSNTTYRHFPSKTVRQVHYLILPFVGIAIVYFDSIFYKLASPTWLNGLGSWLPSSLPMITHSQNTWLLNQELLIKFIGWGTILFEAIFLVVFFRKKWRVPVFIIGMLLHIGIVIEFPIPWFGLTVCSIYLLLVPVSFWQKTFSINKSKPTLFFYYDRNCPLCLRTVIILSHFDWFNKISFKTVQLDASSDIQISSIDEDILLDDIHSVNLKGEIFSGIDTYIECLTRIWFLSPLALLLRISGVNYLAKRVYSYIAKNRNTVRCTEDNCGFNIPEIRDNNQLKILKNLKYEDFKFYLVKYFLVFVVFMQATLIINDSWLVEKVKTNLGIEKSLVNQKIKKLIFPLHKFTRTYFGITSHQVFTERIHFDNYNHIVAITYLNEEGNEIWLPIIDQRGMPDFYIYGANWVKWTFRVISLNVSQGNLEKGVRDFTFFWAEHNGINLKLSRKHQFNIKVKKIDSPRGWEKDFLTKQIDKPWVNGGYVIWEKREFSSFLKNIEEL